MANKIFSWNELISKKVIIMGVLNVTPDSFSDGGQYFDKEKAILHAIELIEEGTDIIDIGGESTRPNAIEISEEEELERVIPVVEGLSKYIKNNKLKTKISIDTTKSIVAKKALEYGAHIVNDVSALEDNNMINIIKIYNCGLVLMHRKGTPNTMQLNPEYNNVVKEVKQFLKERTNLAIKNGILKSQIAIDPGIGFGKTVEHNLLILKHIKELKKLNYPILIGTSRKSFIGKILNREIHERQFGTAATVAWSIINGAKIIRVHDVKEMKDVTRIIEAIQKI